MPRRWRSGQQEGRGERSRGTLERRQQQLLRASRDSTAAALALPRLRKQWGEGNGAAAPPGGAQSEAEELLPPPAAAPPHYGATGNRYMTRHMT